MSPAPPVLSVLRHALADPISAATVKAEVLAARLQREAPALAPRAKDLAEDLTTAGRLLDLLAALAAIGEEPPERTSLERLVAPFGRVEPATEGARLVRVRPAASADAIRRVVSSGSMRGGVPRVAARTSALSVDVLVDGLGPAPPAPLEKLLLLPRSAEGGEELFLARAAVVADGGRLELTERDGELGAVLSWPIEGEAE